jgi:hypothetical protein
MSLDDANNFERTLELGKALAKDLDNRDLLGHWMAHHISDLITRAGATTGPDSDTLGREACNTILMLWNHRAAAPLRSRPTYNMDVVIRALERLGGTRDWEFYNTFRPGMEPDQNTTAGIAALQLALDLETTAREILLQLIRFAANEAENKEEPWVRLTETLTDDSQRDQWRLIRQLERRHRLRQTLTESDDVDDDDNDDEAAHISSALRGAQARLATICSSIQDVLPTGKDPEPTPTSDSTADPT